MHKNHIKSTQILTAFVTFVTTHRMNIFHMLIQFKIVGKIYIT